MPPVTAPYSVAWTSTSSKPRLETAIRACVVFVPMGIFRSKNAISSSGMTAHPDTPNSTETSSTLILSNIFNTRPV
jgi:hypothetical protein